MVAEEIRLNLVSDDGFNREFLVRGLTNRLRPPIGARLNEKQIKELLLESQTTETPLRIEIS